MNKHKYNNTTKLNKLTNTTLTPLLNLHFIQGRRSRALAQALPTLNKRFKKSSQTKGFTIIEVVLVLAIAGLIFLMVFIALPALQRSQRDTARKNTISMYRDAIERYRSNNRGKDYWDPMTNITSKTVWNVNNIYSYFGKNTDGTHQLTDPSGMPYRFYIKNLPDDSTLPPSITSGVVGFRPKWNPHIDNVPVYVSLRRGCSSNGELELRSGDRRYAIQIALESGGSFCIDG